MESKRPLILVTGANGFIAARTVEAFLKADYDVRGTIRSIRSGIAIKEALAEYVKSGRLELVVVPDITTEGAFEEAVKGELQQMITQCLSSQTESTLKVAMASPILLLLSACHLQTRFLFYMVPSMAPLDYLKERTNMDMISRRWY